MSNLPKTLWWLPLIFVALASVATANESVSVMRNIASMPLAFTENQGQWDEQVLFRANAGGATMWFTKDGAVYQFTRRIPRTEDNALTGHSVIASESATADERGNLVGNSGRQMPSSAPDMMHQPDSIETMMIKANFVGANPNPLMTGIDAMEYKCNYFIGNDPNEWHTDVPNYQAIVYEEIYSGIDLKYYGNGKQMEYDFIVEPGADFSQIKIQYDGAESISINDNGELIVETKWGEVVEQRPVIYQTENNSRIAVAGEYRLTGDNSFGFELGDSYDPALPLVIDPTLVYSTYLGGISADIGYGIAVDDSGNAYITGRTLSSDFPTDGEYQSYQGGSDAFVTKLNSSGSSLVYSTYLGGSDYDRGLGIAVDSSDNAYITGSTGSSDFPTLNPFQGTYQGGWSDVFVTKLSVLIDSDGDSVPEDGDGSGTPGDNPCTGGETTNCDDNCPDIANPDQGDADSDGVGDICDNSPNDYNPGQEDSDGDGEGDVSDDCTDTDGDGFGNPGFPANTCPDDNCPYAYNPSQEDSDSNGVGDECDVGCCQIRGDIDRSGVDPDISDLVFLVDYMFNNGFEPPCFEEADMNASGAIDISDLVYLVDYMFNSGPAPVACP